MKQKPHKTGISLSFVTFTILKKANIQPSLTKLSYDKATSEVNLRDLSTSGAIKKLTYSPLNCDLQADNRVLLPDNSYNDCFIAVHDLLTMIITRQLNYQA